MNDRIVSSGHDSTDESQDPNGEHLPPETMGQLSAQIAHDFNNILAVTLTSVEVAMRVGDTAKANSFLSNAIDVIQRGRTLTDRLAAASNACEKATRVDVHALILELGREFESTRGHSVRLLTQLDAQQRVVTIDREFFARSLHNLVMNAHEAMRGEGNVMLSTRNASGAELHADKSRQYMVIAVKDTGVGMADDVRNRAFELFFTTKTSEPWRGTGLKQVRDALRRAGGSAAIESRPGNGTTVTLAIPLS